MFKVLCPEPIEKVGEDYLLARNYKVVTPDQCDYESFRREIADADAVIVRMGIKLDAPLLRAGKKLKIVARHGIGYDNIDVKTAQELGIYVTNARNASTNAVAEQAMMLILSLAKQIPKYKNAVQLGQWNRRNLVKTVELQGKTLGLIGLGANGLRLAEIARFGFRMKIIGFDPYADVSRLPEYVTYVDEKQKVLAQADIVSMHCLLTEETRHFIAERELTAMKPGAWLINCARGGLVDEKALYEKLRTGRIGAAGLDVYEQEPPDPGNPLFSLDNFMGTLHQASNTAEASDRCALSAAEAVDDVLCGRTPRYPVNHPEKDRRR